MNIELRGPKYCLLVRVRFVDLPLLAATGTKTARLCLQGEVSCSMGSPWIPVRPHQGSAWGSSWSGHCWGESSWPAWLHVGIAGAKTTRSNSSWIFLDGRIKTPKVWEIDQLCWHAWLHLLFLRSSPIQQVWMPKCLGLPFNYMFLCCIP